MNHNFLLFLGIVLLFGVISNIGFRAYMTLAMMRYSQMLNYSLSLRLFKGYLYQPYTWFLSRHSADLGKSVLSEVAHVVNTSLVALLDLVSRIIIALFLICLLMLVNPLIAVSSAVGLGLAYIIISYAVKNYAYRVGVERAQANKTQFQAIQEGLVGIKDVKIFGLEEPLIKRFSRPARLFAQSNAKVITVAQIPRFALEAIAFSGMLLIILVLLQIEAELSGVIPVITLYAFAAYRLLPALQGIYYSLTTIKYSRFSLDALHKDLTEIAKTSQSKKQKPHPVKKRRPLQSFLELKNIHYRYPESEKWSLNNLNLKISANSTVALVGGSGAGKTTIADVILGLLTPQKGQLLVDGTIITSEKLRSWQMSIGYVPQQIFLMDDTISGNIGFGIPESERNMAEIERAADNAGLHQFIVNELSDGYQTMIGEAGVKLSGGQRQRIGIARALYRNPDVLIMDEATNALDSVTEQAVMEAIHTLGKTKTVILIAHRLSTVKDCDELFYIVSGRLQDQGTFQTLIKESEEFAQLAKAGLV